MIVKTDGEMIKSYLEDSSNLKGGNADKVVIPGNVEELASFIKEANLKKIPLTISGGGTGTTGSRIPFGGIVVSMENLNRIIDVSTSRMSAVVEAGVLVDDLKNRVEGEGLFYTSHPTEKTASVGGTVATNASGSRSFRYGPTRKYIKRLKMVLADGVLFEFSRGQIVINKDNPRFVLPTGKKILVPLSAYRMPDVKSSAGYYIKDGMDLIDLFIGQEGTLSVIAEIELGLIKKPVAIFSSFVFFAKEEDAWDFTEDVKGCRGLDLLSIEYFDHNAVDILRSRNKNVPDGISAAIFFEQDISEKNPDSVTADWANRITKHGTSLDSTWVAMNEKDAGMFTELRYTIPDSVNDMIRQTGFRKFSTDIAVPGDKLREMMDFYKMTFKKARLGHIIFGHIGENHLHVNIRPTSPEEVCMAEKLSMEFVEKGISLGGTVSAEHGIGKLKHKYLKAMYKESGVLDMARLKKSLDPNCILGLGNIFSKEILEAA